ncbi:MAG: MOSC domain-containing protein [Ilumatobacteraceae bacterium]
MHRIGPYEFTETDAKRTLQNFPPVFELFGQGRDASLIEHLRPTFTGDLVTDLDAAWAAFTGAGPILRAAGQLPPTATGTVAQLNRNHGGLPKLPVPAVEIDFRGVVGDRQATRFHHGRPWQALCLWSSEVIDALAADGHPVFPGAAGENVTISGLPWADVRAGVRLRLGTALCEVSAYAVPCFQNKPYFRDGDFETMHHGRGPVSRVYATVLETGTVSIGDPAILEP